MRRRRRLSALQCFEVVLDVALADAAADACSGNETQVDTAFHRHAEDHRRAASAAAVSAAADAAPAARTGCTAMAGAFAPAIAVAALAGAGAGDGFAAPAPVPAVSITASSAPTGKVCPSAATSFAITPVPGDGISVSTLSVEISHSG